MLPPRQADVKRKRGDDESHEIDVVHGVRLFGRQVCAVAMRPHQCEDDEVRLQWEAVVALERAGDAWVDAHRR